MKAIKKQALRPSLDLLNWLGNYSTQNRMALMRHRKTKL